MFKRLTIKEQLRLERQKNNVLQVRISELEDALIELAEVITEEDQNGENIPSET